MKEETENIKHESFGMISFTRTNSNGQTFFGSELQQQNYISMEIHGGEVRRDLSKEWYSQDRSRPIVRLRLSSNQFAELITSLNCGDGVPCTLERLNGVKVEHLEIENRKDFIHKKFEERMKEFGDSLKPKSIAVKELLSKPKLSKEDKRSLQWIIEQTIQEVNSNIPFFLRCFQEDADKVVQDAKSEVENAIMHKITSAGMEKLFEDGLLKLK
jgi:hypothetical protein